ncbi:nucleotidyltransferase family protein [Afipia carboxidovorans]|uniref:nucleotidyltransferase family protein n=1 Tax=Afipia carboxidovorans TaxID=40137 RepID=UPI00017F5E7E|nr:nucleotidyltransferase family protein [Afipia carboxidovorans]
MASYSHTLLPLCECLCGRPPHRGDWKAIIALANHTLTTPSLIACVRSHRAALPKDVVSYVEELHDRNAIRNERLNTQLEEAILTLNDAGITPLLIKGAAMLATSPPSARALRLMCDLDLIVYPDEMDAAKQALASIGYHVDHESDGQQAKWYADLKRPCDVGMIDLHQGFPDRSCFNQTPDDLRSHLHPIRIGTANALVPSLELRALVLLGHDQFQDYDYWTGSIDLRHLLDLRDLLTAPNGMQWDKLMAMVSGTLARNAVETRLLLLTTLFDIQWPTHHPKRLVPRLQVWRQLLQARIPLIRYFLLPMGFLDYRHHRARAGLPAPDERDRRYFPKLSTLYFLISLSHKYRTGKI